MTGINVLNVGARGNLFAIQNAQRNVAQITERIATGKRVNSALDNPQNFFASRSLSFRANDFLRVLDGISQSIRAIEEASNGLSALSQLLNQAQGVANTSLDAVNSGGVDPSVYEKQIGETTPLSDLILAQNPVAYFRLNETGGGTAVNLGTGGPALNATYQGGAQAGAAALYSNGGDVSTQFDGNNDGVHVPDSALINTGTYSERTIELVFNANDVNTTQVLYEEGGGTHGLTLYVDNGNLILTAEHNGNYSDLSFTAPINAGQTYHVALVFDQPNDRLSGYLNGTELGSASVNGQLFPSHGGDIGIGYSPDSFQLDPGSGGAGFNFDGRISDVAIYNTALSQAELTTHVNSLSGDTEFRNSNFETVLEQIDSLLEDVTFQGVNLLQGGSLVTTFNPDGSSRLVTQGVRFSAEDFSFSETGFDEIAGIENIIAQVNDALDDVETFVRSLSTDLTIIQTRGSFTQDLINNHLAGSDDLTNADLNEESANLIAAQTQLILAQETLSLVSSANASFFNSLANGLAGAGFNLRV